LVLTPNQSISCSTAQDLEANHKSLGLAAKVQSNSSRHQQDTWRDYTEDTFGVESLLEEGGETAEHSQSQCIRVKLTGYRLLTMSVLVGFGTTKAIESLQSKAVAVTWIEWVSGGILAAL
jgi:hypothetical protein